MARTKKNQIWILDVIHGKFPSGKLVDLIKSTAKKDLEKYGSKYFVGLNQDPASAGIHEIHFLIKELFGFAVKTYKETGDKITRSNPFAVQFQNNNVFILKRDWNKKYKEELTSFPEGIHDDMVDASAMGFNALSEIVIANIQEVSVDDEIEDYSNRYRNK